MKKILLVILTILLIILTYIVLSRSISIAGFKIESISDIKNASENLNQDLNKANSLVDETYPKEMTSLEEDIKNLKIAKQKYESKNIYNTNENQLGTIEIDTYKIHFLWTRLGNYKKNRGLKSLNLDLETTQSADVYDLQFKLVGEYSSIIEFLYDIENDEELNFEIKNFKMEPYTLTTTTTIKDLNNNKQVTNKVNPYDTITQTTTSANVVNNTNTTNTNTDNKKNNTTSNDSASAGQTTIYDPKWVEATFTVEDVGVTLD